MNSLRSVCSQLPNNNSQATTKADGNNNRIPATSFIAHSRRHTYPFVVTLLFNNNGGSSIIPFPRGYLNRVHITRSCITCTNAFACAWFCSSLFTSSILQLPEQKVNNVLIIIAYIRMRSWTITEEKAWIKVQIATMQMPTQNVLIEWAQFSRNFANYSSILLWWKHWNWRCQGSEYTHGHLTELTLCFVSFSGFVWRRSH